MAQTSIDTSDQADCQSGNSLAWTACVDRICARMPNSNSGLLAWDSASGESPWVWAARAGIPEAVQLEAVAESLGVDFRRDLASLPSSPSFLAQIPIAYARRHVMLGLSESESAIRLAIGRRETWSQIDILRRLLRA